MAGAPTRPANKGKKPARDVKGKGKSKPGPAVHGRGVQARQVRRQTYEEELKQLEQRLEELVSSLEVAYKLPHTINLPHARRTQLPPLQRVRSQSFPTSLSHRQHYQDWIHAISTVLPQFKLVHYLIP